MQIRPVIYPTPLIIIEFKCVIYLQNAEKKTDLTLTCFSLQNMFNHLYTGSYNTH